MRAVAIAAVSSMIALGACASADPDGGGDPGGDGGGTGGGDGGGNPTDAAIDADPCAGQLWYPDTDGDGHGAAAGAMGSCTQPAGFVASADDCDDASAYAYPGRAEVCDGLDNDCAPATAETCSLGCVVRLRPGDNRRYLFCAVATTWPAAQTHCSGNAFRLMRVDDLAENSWARTTADGALGANNFWIGGNDRLVENAWRWDDGVQFWQGTSGGAPVGGLFASWDSGEPNDDGTEDCAELRTNGRWNDGDCNGARPFVCERY